MAHLDDNTAANLLQGVLSSDERRVVEKHLDACSNCRALLASLADNVTAATVVDGKQRRRTTIVRGSGAVAQLGAVTRIVCVGSAVAQRYLLQEQLGAGGMGSVWGALDNKLNRKVAVKMLHGALEEETELTQRFHGEAMAIAQLKSPHIVQIFDYGVDGSSPFIVMERLDGEDLHTRARSSRLSMEEVVDIIDQVAQGLEAAHSAGLVHRDLKPGNIFLERTMAGVSAKVIDFGIAKALDALSPLARTTADGQIIGTPRYMSPEQLRADRALDHRSDLWSLAVIAYRLLTERYPFNADTPTLLIGEVLNEQPASPSVLEGALPAAVDTFFARALAKDPAARFQNATSLAQALRQACLGSQSAALGSAPQSAPVLDPVSGSHPASGSQTLSAPPSLSRHMRSRRTVMWGVAMAMALGIGLGWLLLRNDGRSDHTNNSTAGDNTATSSAAQSSSAPLAPNSGVGNAAQGMRQTAPLPPASPGPNLVAGNSTHRPPAAPSSDTAASAAPRTSTDPTASAPAAPASIKAPPAPPTPAPPPRPPQPNPADLFGEPMFFDGGTG